MLTAWRKFTNKKDEKPVFPLGVAPVDQSMQKKYAKGVQYNMKLIIKGDRNTGKSVLLQRLSGNKFKEDYIPTQEIQVSNVNWGYQGNCDIVKTEVWDIVDKSKKKRTPSGSLKISHDEDTVKEDPMEALSLDAEFIDVYKGTHGVFLIMDITKAWTWKYVQRELEKIPYHIPVLILANFRDMGDHRVVYSDEVVAYLQYLDRPAGSAEVYFTESSMKDGFGLQYIHNFLNMPFLLLQRESLMRQLEANTLEIDDTRETLSYEPSSEQRNYELFREMLASKANASKSDSPIAPLKTIDNTTEAPKETSTHDVPQPNITQTGTKQVPVATVTPTVQKSFPDQQQPIQPSPQLALKQQQKQRQESPHQISKFQAYKEKLFGTKNTPAKETPTLDISDLDVVPIEDFNPGMLDNDFLDNAPSHTKSDSKKMTKALDSDDDSDGNGGNPMVAAYEDFDDSDDDIQPVEDFGHQQIAVAESEDDDFEDFSSDEEKEGGGSKGENNLSIMDQIKASKKLEKQNKVKVKEAEEITVSTQELDINDTEYTQLDTDTEDDKLKYITEVKETPPSTNSTLEIYPEPVVTNSNDKTNGVNTIIKNNKNEASGDDEEDENEINPYVITDDVDVDNDWMKETESEKEEEEEEQNVEDITEEMAPGSESTVAQNIQFDLDDLEAFMSDQMARPSVSNVNDIPTESEKLKKKKTTEATATGNTEKKKKKKSKTKTNESDTPTNKTKKGKKLEGEGGDTVEKKKASKSKSTKAKKSSVNELDAFYAS